jgi:hypothetical protein
MERAHAYRLIASSEVAAVVSPIGDIRSEAVARELSPLRDQSAELMATWSQAIEEHGPAPTAAQVLAGPRSWVHLL